MKKKQVFLVCIIVHFGPTHTVIFLDEIDNYRFYGIIKNKSVDLPIPMKPNPKQAKIYITLKNKRKKFQIVKFDRFTNHNLESGLSFSLKKRRDL